MILKHAEIEWSFGLVGKYGPRLPQTYEVLSVLYRALRFDGIDAIQAIQGVIAHPECVKAILDLLGDDEIFEVSAAACAMPIMTLNISKSVDIMKAWAARQAVFKTLRGKGISTGEI